MADQPDSIILEYLRRFDRKLDALAADVHDLKVRVTAIEERLAAVERSIAGVNRRIDRVEERLDRIEKRLEIVEAPHLDEDR